MYGLTCSSIFFFNRLVLWRVLIAELNAQYRRTIFILNFKIIICGLTICLNLKTVIFKAFLYLREATWEIIWWTNTVERNGKRYKWAIRCHSWSREIKGQRRRRGIQASYITPKKWDGNLSFWWRKINLSFFEMHLFPEIYFFTLCL